MTGILAGCMTGLIRTIHCKKDTVVDVVPVDFVANLSVAAAYKRSKETLGICPYYNEGGPMSKDLTCLIFHQQMLRVINSYVPLKSLFWYPRSSFVSSLTVYWFSFFFTQLIPAILFDFLLLLCRKRP